MCFFVKSKRDDYITSNKLISIAKIEFSRQIKARYTTTQYSEEKSPSKTIMGNFNSKCKEDENCLRIEDLPVEILVKIIGYLNTTEKIKAFSMVNRRWFDIANNEIEALPIKWPQEKSQDIQNLIVRFPRLKNLELATKITNKDMILPIDSFLDSFGFDGTMEFDVSPYLIQTKNPESTFITRIKINPAKEKDFEYKEYQIVSLDIVLIDNQHHDSVIEEILSLDNVSKIRYTEVAMDQQEFLNFVKTIQALLSMPILKQIVIDVNLILDQVTLALDIEEEFPKNCNVEEITLILDCNGLDNNNNCNKNGLDKVWNKLFDALPSIKNFKVAIQEDFENLPVILKNISVLKHLKSLHVSINSRDDFKRFDAQKFGHILEIRECCEIIKNNFPMNSEVIIADWSYWSYRSFSFPFEYLFSGDYSTNLIEKERGENPKIVNGLSQ